ncbi:uncharacterized protein NEMAJ01_2370, partial [Nematocida major]|uniref:uncharacterized protein n=1 Tax=Nematocida major TaxID=1912982 RepID=UPI002007FAEF
KTKKYVTELFESLSVNKSLKVEFSDLKVDARSDGQKDLYGKIALKYTDKDSVIEQGLCLAFKPGHLTVTLCPCAFLSSASGKEEAFFAVDSCSEPKTFAECLLAKYADAWRARGLGPQGKMLAQGIREATGRLAEDAAPEHLNELLVLGLALKQDPVFAITKDFIFHAAAKGTELTQEHPGVRLLSNLLGSLPLDDYATQCNSLGDIVCLDVLGKLFPKIGLAKNTFVIFYRHPYSILNICEHTGTNCAPAGNAIMKYFREYKDKAGKPLFWCELLTENFNINLLFPLLLADKSTRHIDEIGTLLLDVEEEDRKDALDTKALFDLFVFLASLKYKETPHELVLALGSRLKPRSIQACKKANCMILVSRQTASAMLEALGTHQSALLQTPSGEEVLDGVQHILQSILNRRA